MKYDNKTIGGILLIAGTSIGAGMLALPITTARGGFVCSVILFGICFLYMLISLFLLLEANLYETTYEANIISMAKKRLGTIGQFVAWFSFLLLLYAVAAAYISAGGSLITNLYEAIAKHPIPNNVGVAIFIIVFGGSVFFGTWVVDYVNRLLMIGLILSYFSLIIFVTPHVKSHYLLASGNPRYLLAAVPVVVLSFTSHIIVPTLRVYLHNNVAQLKKVLLLGSLVPLIFYIVWELLILGVIPVTGEFGLTVISKGPHPVAALTDVLNKHLGLMWIALSVGAFSFFALVTSFLGVVLSLMDFLADGFQIKKDVKGRLRLLLFTIVPPLLFALYYPSGFVLALSYAGVFVAILYGILPVIMIWKERYVEKVAGPYQVPGGKPLLVFMFLGALLIIFFQVAATLNWLPSV